MGNNSPVLLFLRNRLIEPLRLSGGSRGGGGGGGGGGEGRAPILNFSVDLDWKLNLRTDYTTKRVFSCDYGFIDNSYSLIRSNALLSSGSFFIFFNCVCLLNRNEIQHLVLCMHAYARSRVCACGE